MKFAPFIPLLGLICNFSLAVFVFRSNPKATVNRLYFALGLAISGWNLGQYFNFTVTSHATALFWTHFLWMCVISGPFILLHLSLHIAGIRTHRYFGLIYALCGLFVALNLTSVFVSDVRWLDTAGWYAVAGPAFFSFPPVFCVLLVVSIVILLRRRRTLPKLHKTRLNALIIAQGLLLASGLNDLLPIMQVDKYPFTHTSVFPYGSVAAVFYGLIVGYSVLQHQLLNVQVTLSRYAAQVVRFLFFVLIGILLMLTVTLIAPSAFNTTSFFLSLGVLLLSGAIASTFFPRIFGNGLEILEQRILGDRFEYHDRIRSFMDSMQYYSDTNALFDALKELLMNTAEIMRFHVIFRDDLTRGFSIVLAHPPDLRTEVPELQDDSAIFEYFKRTQLRYLAFNQDGRNTDSGKLPRSAREFLARFAPEFCFPFFTQEEPFGLLLIGPKRNDEVFTATDINLLTALAARLSLIVNQIRLHEQVLRQQELELLGRMSSGMAHDLNNLLTPISTFFQLSSEGVPVDSLNDELLPVAFHNVSTIRSYIKEALFFSENLRPDFQLSRLDILARRATDLALHSRGGSGVEISLQDAGEILVEMDEVLIQRMLSNILANAIDASSPGNTIQIEIRRLAKSDGTCDWLRLRVIDFGKGIAKQDIRRVLTPYYTTKNRGDGSRGFGLGLAICLKIVNLHGGKLHVASQHGQGTTVQIDLPSRQIAQPTSAVRKF